MKLLYLAGPLPSKSAWRAYVTSKIATEFSVINPEIIEVKDNYNIVNVDKHYIGKSDIILANITGLSVGTSMEIIYAHSLNKYVITVCPDHFLSPWHVAHSTIVLPDLDLALNHILNIP